MNKKKNTIINELNKRGTENGKTIEILTKLILTRNESLLEIKKWKEAHSTTGWQIMAITTAIVIVAQVGFGHDIFRSFVDFALGGSGSPMVLTVSTFLLALILVSFSTTSAHFFGLTSREHQDWVLGDEYTSLDKEVYDNGRRKSVYNAYFFAFVAIMTTIALLYVRITIGEALQGDIIMAKDVGSVISALQIFQICFFIAVVILEIKVGKYLLVAIRFIFKGIKNNRRLNKIHRLYSIITDEDRILYDSYKDLENNENIDVSKLHISGLNKSTTACISRPMFRSTEEMDKYLLPIMAYLALPVGNPVQNGGAQSIMEVV